VIRVGSRLRLSLALGCVAFGYLLALSLSTRFGLGVGLDQLSASPGSIRSSISYAADMPMIVAQLEPTMTSAVQVASAPAQAAQVEAGAVIRVTDAAGVPVAVAVPQPAVSSKPNPQPTKSSEQHKSGGSGGDDD